MNEHQVCSGRKVETATGILYPWFLTHQLRFNGGILEQRWRRSRHVKDKDLGERFVGYEYKWEKVPEVGAGKYDQTTIREGD
jgi:hypothetical protein